MGMYRKKPVVVEARLLAEDVAPEIALWCGGRLVEDFTPFTKHVLGLDIPTLEGVMRADVGDWVIRGVKGEFYPCKPDVFAATYEEIEG